MSPPGEVIPANNNFMFVGGNDLKWWRADGGEMTSPGGEVTFGGESS